MNRTGTRRAMRIVALVAAIAAPVAVPAHAAAGAWLGVSMQDVSRAMARALHLEDAEGVLVAEVIDDSPAAKAGLEEGDVIVRLGDEAIESPRDLRRAVERARPGETVSLVDDDWAYRFDMPGMQRLRRMMMRLARPRLGVEAAELNRDLAAYFKVKDGEGVLVLDVHDDTIAEKAGLRPGDVIRRIGDDRIDDVDDVRDALEDVEPGSTLRIEIVRHGREKRLEARVDEEDLEGTLAMRAPRWHRRPGRVWRDDGVDREAMRDLRRQVERLRREFEKLRREVHEDRG